MIYLQLGFSFVIFFRDTYEPIRKQPRQIKSSNYDVLAASERCGEFFTVYRGWIFMLLVDFVYMTFVCNTFEIEGMIMNDEWTYIIYFVLFVLH